MLNRSAQLRDRGFATEPQSHRATEKVGEKGIPIDLSGFPEVSEVSAVATMRYTKYSKWTGQSWDDISLEELMEALSDYLLRSGFEDQFRRHYRRWSQDWGYDEFDDLD